MNASSIAKHFVKVATSSDVAAPVNSIECPTKIAKNVNNIIQGTVFDLLFLPKNEHKTNKEIKNTASYIQKQLIVKLIIPYFEKNYDGNETFEKLLNCKNLIQDYFKFVHTDINVFSEFVETSEYKKLNNMFEKLKKDKFRRNLIVDLNTENCQVIEKSSNKARENDER